MIEQLILISFFCVGWITLLQEGMILERLGEKIDNMGFWGKPLGGCVPCSASIVGLIGYILLNYVPFGEIAVIIIGVVGLNKIIWFYIEDIVLTVNFKRNKNGEKRTMAAKNAKNTET